jgi:hypothetical protein
MDNVNIEAIIEEIEQIPAETGSFDLYAKLEPLMEGVAVLNAALREGVLGKVKDRFKLDRNEVSGYRSLLKDLKKKTGQSGETVSDYTAQHPDLIDLVLDDNGDVAFLMAGENGPQVQSSIEEDDCTFLPPELGSIPFPLVNADKVQDAYVNDTDSQLFDSLVHYHSEISDLLDEWYRILAAWDMHTWIIENFYYSPIMCFYAVPERGKSRTTKGMVNVAYRAITTENLRESYLIRITQDYGATVCFDVTDFSKKTRHEGSDDVFLLRFERGAKVARVNRPEAGKHRDIDYYEIFAPTIICTNEQLDHILDTRAITCVMQDSARPFQNDVRAKDALPNRERLTAFRARHMGTELPKVEKPSSGRLGDILRPFRQVIKLVKPSWENEFMNWVEDIKEDRLSVKQDSFEGQLLKAVHANFGKRLPDDRMFVSDVTAIINRSRSQHRPLTPALVSNKLRSLGFKRGTKHNKGNTIECSDVVFYQIADSYGIKIEPSQDENRPDPLDDERQSA